MSAPDRAPCPVQTCSNPLPSGAFMCAECWGLLPRFIRVAVDVTSRDATRRPTKRNRDRAASAERAAIQHATGLRT